MGQTRPVENRDTDDSFDDGEVQPKKACCYHLDRVSMFIYSSHFLSSFGDRIWHFAVGLYLYYLYPCTLMLTAVYGLSTCGALFILGASVGQWVDMSTRLTAAKITIIVQNTAVVVCATVMALAIYYQEEVNEIWNGNLKLVIYAIIIVAEIVAELASMGNKLVLEKDWIVVLANGDNQKLSYLNATMRTINLTCKILAPFAVGHLLDHVCYVTGAIILGSWNVISAFVEFRLLHIIFKLVPQLSMKGTEYKEMKKTVGKTKAAIESLTNVVEKSPSSVSNDATNEAMDNTYTLDGEFHEISLVSPDATRTSSRDQLSAGNTSRLRSVIQVKNRLCDIWTGWKIYFSHPVSFAGAALASLYMTVLSFDNVIIGYLSSQGMSASQSGNITAVAAFVGIMGSLSFPFWRRTLGKNNAGILGFGMETVCLLLCLCSVIAPGSPFVPSAIANMFAYSGTSSKCDNVYVAVKPLSLREHWEEHFNVILLVGGIVLARYGLWIADLSVTQIFQEKVKESDRGVMGGVQGSLNQLMSLIKFCLTILLPYPETFGYLICLSWIFVFVGFVLFITYVSQDRSGRRVVPVPEHGELTRRQNN